MKKSLNFIILGLIALVLVLPMGAKADTSIGLSCGEESTKRSDGTYSKKCTLDVEGNTETMTQFEATLNLPEGIELLEINGADGWTGKINNGNKIILVSTDGVTEKDFTMATVTLKLANTVTEDCTVSMVIEGMEQIVTEKITIEQSPNTGASLPLIVLCAGAGVAGVAYYMSKKNKKMYKI